MELPPLKNSLLTTLGLAIAPAIFIVTLGYLACVAYLELNSLRHEREILLKHLTRNYAQVLALPMWNLERSVLDAFLESTYLSPEVECIEIKGQSFYNQKFPQNCNPKIKTHVLEQEVLYSPNQVNPQALGTLKVTYAFEISTDKWLKRILLQAPVAIFCVLIVQAIVFLILKLRVIKPASELVKSMQALGERHERIVVEWETNDELGWLVTAYNRLSQQLKDYELALLEQKTSIESAYTELKEVQSQLISSERMASLGQMVAGMTHEINTPIGVAFTTATYQHEQTTRVRRRFSEGKITKKDLETYLDDIEESVQLLRMNLNRAVDLMKSFKEVSADQTSGENRIFDLTAYAQSVATSLRHEIKLKKVNVNIEGEQLHIESSPGFFSQIFTNLIINSCRHGFSDASSNNQVTITISHEAPNILVIYEDNGNGIPDANLDSIFEPFFTTKKSQGGTGLGMHILKTLIEERLQGSVCVHNVEQGVRFSISIPDQWMVEC
jgi:two-component system NtrC family sensor kinase